MPRRKNAQVLKITKLIACMPSEVQVRVWKTINELREHFNSDSETLTWALRYMEAGRRDALSPVPRLGRSKEAVREGVAESKGVEDVTN
mgnify:CR=1 FL=1